jgi:hypothetical protein
MAEEILLRCTDCAFLNPEESVFCGMCGSKLAHIHTPKKTDPKYESKILSGTIRDSFDYGYEKTFAHVWMLILGSIITVICISIVAGSTSLWGAILGHYWIWILIDIPIVAVLWTASCRVFLDITRGDGVDLVRALGSGVLNIIPATYVTFIFALVALIAAGIIYAWTLPVAWIDSPDSPVSEGTAVFLIFTWFIVLLILILVPTLIWLFMGTTMALCRIIDRKSNPWMSPVWAMSRIIEHHWQLFWMGLGMLFAQLIGMSICYIGSLVTFPLAGVSTASIYEWLRLHGHASDDY